MPPEQVMMSVTDCHQKGNGLGFLLVLGKSGKRMAPS